MDIFYSPKFWALCSFIIFFTVQYLLIKRTEKKIIKAIPSIFVVICCVPALMLALGYFAENLARWNIHMIIAAAVAYPIAAAILGIILAFLINSLKKYSYKISDRTENN